MSDQAPRVLPARSLRALADALPALYAETAVSELPRAFADLLVKLIPGDSCGVVIDDRGRMKRFWHHWPVEPENASFVPELFVSTREGGDHGWHGVIGSSAVRARTDLPDEQPPAGLDLRDVYRPRLGSEEELGIRVQHGEVVMCATVSRRCGGFSAEERELMNALRPHFKQAWANAHCFTQLAAASSQTSSAATWMTEPLEVRYGLTPREGEVLIWVAQGKTNPEVATILGVQPSTVRTHLERIFAKLGVETRHAAGLRAIEVLGMPAA
jgi:DNA-binding CsgD family transcriptional regulator